MRLPLFSSRHATPSHPNLVSLQHPSLTDQPTVLVCPVGDDLLPTPLRARFIWEGQTYVVGCDLIRPIRRRALRLVGELDDATSREILATFHRLLAR